jgi:hypothetical protein
MTADPVDILPTLLNLPQLAGKDDRELTRLKQYKNLEVKAVERASSSISHEEFLRQCGITVEFDYEVEKNFDRLVELANRTNQLNFTKIRLETPEAVSDMHTLMATYGVTAGLVRVRDKYGDYGITGFFVVNRNGVKNNLLHFVFSCRTMNMGIEQYVYEWLQSPAVNVVQPVANPISTFKKIDWIKEGPAGTHQLGHSTSGKKLLLIGGCELLQISSMCSSNREEFVNTIRNKWPVRFDDVGFITGDRQVIKNDKAVENLNYWNYDDTQRFDEALAQSEIVIAALFVNLSSSRFFKSESGTVLRLSENNMKRVLRRDGTAFFKNFRHVKLSTKEKLDRITNALDHMATNSLPGARCFALGVNTKRLSSSSRLAAAGWPECLRTEPRRAKWLKLVWGLPPQDRMAGRRHLFNRYLQDYCARSADFTFIDVDSLVTAEDVFDRDPKTGYVLADHFTRRGFIAIAAEIAAHLKTSPLAAAT